MRLNPKFIGGAIVIAIPVATHAQATPPAEPAKPETTQPAPAKPETPTPTQTQSKQVTPATEADVKAGVSVYDADGNAVGKIESVDAKGAVVSTGTAKAQIPISSIGKNHKGLVIAMTRAELEAAAKEKSPK